jgi:hypothetical protein
VIYFNSYPVSIPVGLPILTNEDSRKGEAGLFKATSCYGYFLGTELAPFHRKNVTLSNNKDE